MCNSLAGVWHLVSYIPSSLSWSLHVAVPLDGGWWSWQSRYKCDSGNLGCVALTTCKTPEAANWHWCWGGIQWFVADWIWLQQRARIFEGMALERASVRLWGTLVLCQGCGNGFSRYFVPAADQQQHEISGHLDHCMGNRPNGFKIRKKKVFSRLL